MKIFGVIALVIALAFAAEAYTPYNYAISASGNCTSGYVKVCNGNTVCPSYNSMGCCGGCSSSYCGLCGSGYTCISGSCAWIYSIVIGCVIGGIFFFAIVGAIVRAFLRHRAGTYHDSGPRTIIVQEQPVAPVVYAEETVVIAPPAQQPYAPNTYVANPQGQQVVYTQSPYGAPAGNQQVIYSSGGVHETY